jgi:hypothetical protein
MIDADVDALRDDVRLLCARHARGDIREKSFQQALAERTVGLYRALVQRQLADGEAILHEHHVVTGHTKLAQSILSEPASLATSLFATEKRLFRLRSTLWADTPPTCDDRDGTVIDAVPLDGIDRLVSRRRIRGGEILAGIAIAGCGLAFSQWLSLTGPLLILLGVLGFLHGLLMPTRWIEVVPKGASGEDDHILVYAVRKKSAKRLLHYLRERIGPGSSS